MKELLEKLKAFVSDYNLIEKGSKIGVAVSGGPDSVFLLKVLHELKSFYNLKLIVLHFNHQIRKEAKNEEIFVKQLANRFNLPIKVERGDVLKFKSKMRMSLEDAARQKRYEFFEMAKRDLNLDLIATGHTKNDFIETFIMNLLRGSTLDGLVSLKPKRGYFIRPIIFFSKDEIICFLQKMGLEFIVDSSNLNRKFTRNRIRHELIEELKKYNPNIIDTLFREGMSLLEDSAYLKRQTELELIKTTSISPQKATIHLTKINKNPTIIKRVISETVKRFLNSDYSLSSENIKRILETAKSGKKTHLRKLIKAHKKGNCLIIEKYED